MAPTYAAVAAVCASVAASLSGCGGDTPSVNGTTTAFPSPSPDPYPNASCLCLFDVDRTLTGKQGDVGQCPLNLVVSPHVSDLSYGGGDLTLSAAGQGLAETYCAQCYIGTISAGNVSGPDSEERSTLRTRLDVGVGVLPEHWSNGCDNVSSPLVLNCTDGLKQTAIPAIVEWYAARSGVTIADERITLFDDRASNILPFAGGGYNARQISCATRDDPFGNLAEHDKIGLCGAEVSEIIAGKGVYLCPAASVTTTSTTAAGVEIV